MKYTPISCALYDELELAAMRKTPVSIELANGDIVHVIIRTLEARKHDGEYLITESGLEIRLDEIGLFNGKPFEKKC